MAFFAAWLIIRHRRKSGTSGAASSRFERYEDDAWSPGLEMTQPGGGTAGLMGGSGSYVPQPVSSSAAQQGGVNGAPLGVVVQPWGQQQERQNGGNGQLSHRDVNPFA